MVFPDYVLEQVANAFAAEHRRFPNLASAQELRTNVMAEHHARFTAAFVLIIDWCPPPWLACDRCRQLPEFNVPAQSESSEIGSVTK